MDVHAAELPAPPRLSDLGKVALFLDLDGTLAAIETRPENVGPEPWRTALLETLLTHLHGRLAIISGRSLDEVDRILEGAVPAVGAVHGLVRRRADGRVIKPPPHQGIAKARARVEALVRAHPGLQLEDKQLGLAVHFRAVPAAGDLVRREMRAIAADGLEAGGLKLQLGDMVAEIFAAGCDKGAALAAFMTEPPFAGARPVFVGDDLTDEDGFRAAAALGGIGILAGPGRPTGASRRLAGAPAVRAWLEAAVMQDASS